MAYLEWDEKYSVGIKTMDNHHKKLFNIINKLHRGVGSGSTTEVLRKVLSELIDYTKYHFKAEEHLMRKYKYPELLSHIERHNVLIEAVQDLQQLFDEKKGELIILIKLQVLFRNWLINHILYHDKNYGSYLNSKGIDISNSNLFKI